MDLGSQNYSKCLNLLHIFNDLCKRKIIITQIYILCLDQKEHIACNHGTPRGYPIKTKPKEVKIDSKITPTVQAI